MGNPERSNKALKRKKTTQKIIAITSVALLILLAVVLMVRKNVQTKYGNRGKSKVETTQVSTGSIRTTVSGSGALTSEDIEDVNIPSAVTIDTVYVEQGDIIEKGTMIASVKTNSVLSAMADVQAELTSIDKQLVTAGHDNISSVISAGVSGRLKAVYAQSGDSVAAAMYSHGALAVISLDGKMAVDLESADYHVGDTVSVVTSGGKAYEGTVDSVNGSTATVLITDNGPVNEDTVTVNEKDTGTLYIHVPLKITGYTGTISRVSAKENSLVYASTTLFTLKDTAYTANYDQLLVQRADYEEVYQKLVQLYVDGGILSPMDGTVESVIDPDAEEDSTASAMAAAYTSAVPTASAASAGNDLLDETLAAAIDPNKTMSVTITVDETDILSLAVGQEANITVDSIGEETYSGTVSEIDTTAISASGVTAYTAKITMDKAQYMLSGMTADVAITIEGVENAMLVPFDAVHKTSATAYVYTTYDPETDTLGGITEVTIGINDGKQMEITGGLKPGDTIYYVPKEQTFSFGNFTITTGGSSSRNNPHSGQSGMGGMPPMG